MPKQINEANKSTSISNFPEAQQVMATASGPFNGQDGTFMQMMSKSNQSISVPVLEI